MGFEIFAPTWHNTYLSFLRVDYSDVDFDFDFDFYRYAPCTCHAITTDLVIDVKERRGNRRVHFFIRTRKFRTLFLIWMFLVSTACTLNFYWSKLSLAKFPYRKFETRCSYKIVLIKKVLVLFGAVESSMLTSGHWNKINIFNELVESTDICHFTKTCKTFVLTMPWLSKEGGNHFRDVRVWKKVGEWRRVSF